MKPSLSIVLPVRNAQPTLSRQVHALLELVPELTNRFDILIIDDGSTDHTDEVANDLSCEYPQVAFVRNSSPLGYAAAVQTALKHTKGDIVFVQEEGSRLSPADLRRLWELRKDEKLVLARSTPPGPQPFSDDLLYQLGLWGQALQNVPELQNVGGVQMIRRSAVAELQQTDAPAEQLSFAHAPRTEMVRRDVQHTEKDKPRRSAGFLGHLRSLAAGE